MKRRWAEKTVGDSGVLWSEVFRGKGADVGAGNDCIPLPDCRGFDKADGNVERLSDYIQPESLDYIHASQCLEHMSDPAQAVHDWLRCIRPTGFLISTQPDFVLYEGLKWPSQYNPDHRSSWSMWLKGSPAPIHCKLPEWLDQFKCRILTCRLVDSNYDYSVMTTKDQTFNPQDAVECWLEFCIQKP